MTVAETQQEAIAIMNSVDYTRQNVIYVLLTGNDMHKKKKTFHLRVPYYIIRRNSLMTVLVFFDFRFHFDTDNF